MARSSGARPKKAVREEVMELKRLLGETHSDKWQRAQTIFDEICRLCEVKGPSGSRMSFSKRPSSPARFLPATEEAAAPLTPFLRSLPLRTSACDARDSFSRIV